VAFRGIGTAEAIGGLIAVAIGAFAIWEGGSYPIGTARQMGPGYFPVVLGALMIALGLGLWAEGFRAGAEPAERPQLRALLAVLAGIGAFAVLVERAGLVPGTLALVIISSAAARAPRLLPTLILAVAVSGLSVLVFRQFLGLPLPAFAWRW
jgi:hypothetical protein